jgi:hypothetical protein
MKTQNVSEAQVLEYLGVSEKTKMTEADIQKLRVIWKDLKDGKAKVSDYFKGDR